MPATSEAQRKAMFAAAEGRSTLGIPKKVGEEFVGKDDAPQAAGVVFTSPKGRILLMHRAPEEKNYGGHWGLPGGKAEEGETPEVAARREVKEETGYDHAGSLKSLDRVRTPNGMVFTTFAAPVDKEFAPEMADGEHTGFTWADLEHLPQPLHPSVARVLGEHLGVTEDMSPEDWDGLRSGFAKWTREEEDEPEHAEDDASGKLNESEKAEANRTAKEREEQPESAFLQPPDKYPVKVKQDGKWVYSRDLLLAAAREARMHGHEDLAKRADAIRGREFANTEGAHDSLAMDRASVRKFDQDGHLHVEMTPISKAIVNPYAGEEIPDWETLRLDPKKIYQMYRDPEELAKAAPTFAGKPLLHIHKPVGANDHPKELVVGSIGDDVHFAAPYLMAPLHVWDGKAIRLIESDDQKEISCGYAYAPDMTPGVVDGVKYDGVMRSIRGNHVALVTEGRAGPDVVVQDHALKRAGHAGDSKPSWRGKFANDHQPKEAPVAKTLLTRKAAVAQGALMTFLAPKLAQDAKLDLSPILDGITAKNFKAKRADIVTGITKATTGKLAADAKLDGLDAVLMALDDVTPMETEANSAVPAGNAKDKKAKDEEPDRMEKLRAALKDKGASDDMIDAACDAMLDDDQEAMDEDDKDKTAKDEEKDDDKVDKKAMDAAIDTAKREVRVEMQRTQREVREAEDVVRPYVGKLAMAHDSAADVYRTALGALGVKDADKLHPDALKPVLLAQPLPGSTARAASVAMDAAGVNSFHELFPEAKSHPVKTL